MIMAYFTSKPPRREKPEVEITIDEDEIDEEILEEMEDV